MDLSQSSEAALKRMSTCRRSYSPNFKLEVAECGSKEGIRKTGRKYGVGESLVRQWIKNVPRIRQQVQEGGPKCKFSDGSQFYVNHQHLDQKIHNWYNHWTSKGQAVTKYVVIAKAKSVYLEDGFTNFNAEHWHHSWNKAYRKKDGERVSKEESMPGEIPSVADPHNEADTHCNGTVGEVCVDAANQVAPPSICCEVDVETENPDDGLARKKGEHYLPEFKSRVVKYARGHTFKETGAKFGVHHSTVSDWCHLLRDVETVEESDPEAMFVDWLKEEENVSHDKIGDKLRDILDSVRNRKQCRWLVNWADRMSDEHYQKMVKQLESNHPMSKVNVAYPPSVKLEIIKYAAKSSINAASKMFLVSRKNLAEWAKRKDRLQRMVNANRHVNRGAFWKANDDALYAWYERTILLAGARPSADEVRAKATDIFLANGKPNFKASYCWYRGWCERRGIRLRFEHDDPLIDWLLTQFDLNKNVSHCELQMKALSIICLEKPEYKSSAGCIIRFCKRNPNIVAMVPPLDHLLPACMEARISQFRAEVAGSASQSLVGCMDELPICFGGSMDSAKKRKLLIRQPGMDKCDAILLLSAVSDGRLLPPLIIVRGDPIHEDHDDLVLYRKECTVDQEVTCDWLERVWHPNVGSSGNLLVVDCFEGHRGVLVDQKLASSGTTGHVIPAGCSCKLQPLEVVVKPLFARYLGELMEKERSMHQRRRNIVAWVQKICERLRPKGQLIQRSFAATGLVPPCGTDCVVDDGDWVREAIDGCS